MSVHEWVILCNTLLPCLTAPRHWKDMQQQRVDKGWPIGICHSWEWCCAPKVHGTIGALRRKHHPKSIWPLLSWKQSNPRLEHSQYLQAGCTYMLHMLWSSIIHQIISIFRPSVCQFSGMQKVPASQNVYSTTSYVITNFWYQKSKQVNFYQLWDHWNHMKLEIVGEKSPRPRQGQGFVNYIFMPCGYGSENISDAPKKSTMVLYPPFRHHSKQWP